MTGPWSSKVICFDVWMSVSCFRPFSTSVHTYCTVVKGWMGTSRKQHSCDEVWQDVVVFLIPPTLSCRYPSASYEVQVPLFSESQQKIDPVAGSTDHYIARPCFKLPFSMHRAVTGSTQHINRPCSDLIFVHNLRSLTALPIYGHYSSTGTWHIWFYRQNRTGTGKRSLCKHCSEGQSSNNKKKTKKQKKQNWLYLVGEMSEASLPDPCQN